jgi:hypothetical protein
VRDLGAAERLASAEGVSVEVANAIRDAASARFQKEAHELRSALCRSPTDELLRIARAIAEEDER